MMADVMNCSWSSFVQMLQYKADWYGRTIIKIDRFYPSSKLCNKCGYKNQTLSLCDREWLCPQCNVILDRDINAAKNIFIEGARILSGQVLSAELTNSKEVVNSL